MILFGVWVMIGGCVVFCDVATDKKMKDKISLQIEMLKALGVLKLVLFFSIILSILFWPATVYKILKEE